MTGVGEPPPPRAACVLIVDDDATFALMAALDLERSGLRVERAGSLAEARAALAEAAFDLAFVDQRLPDGDGLELIPDLERGNERVQVFVVSAYPSFDHARLALRHRCIADYLTKPVEWPAVRHAIDRALRVAQLERWASAAEYQRQRELTGATPTASAAMLAVEAVIARAATSRAPLLITGATGTGKTVLARRLHALGGAAERPFIALNCAAIPESLFEGELFGAERGAFTGAFEARPGLVELASGGTLFLDEIGEMPLATQAKLLTVLENQMVRRLGSGRDRPVQVRFVAATNREVDRLVGAGQLRADLYYRLTVLTIDLPTLAARRDDLPTLVQAILREVTGTANVPVLADGELERLGRHRWPGNLRELRNVLERAVLFDGPRLMPSRHLTEVGAEALSPAGRPPPAVPLTLAEVERAHILMVYAQVGESQQRASGALGISISTLRRRLVEFGVL